MTKTSGSADYDLEDRTFRFAQAVRTFARRVPKSLQNLEDTRQLIRSSGSVGANYIEANEALSKKDFVHRLRIARKEAKESQYWLRLVDTQDDVSLSDERDGLVREGRELLLIFSAIIRSAS
ncbi:four helix bundle protein [Wenzhouxiangella sp. EGI_FJ10409]|uniref:four helix bundle protein n=1 Tax=Wenzhouxiangella sp. EGI_FJ10409 TaxID=3243767 RepID=UPI0035E0A0F4